MINQTISLSKPYLHIIKKNRSYIYTFTENAVNELSVKTIKFTCDRFEKKDNPFEIIFNYFRDQFYIEQEKYSKFCHERSRLEDFEYDEISMIRYLSQKRIEAEEIGMKFDRFKIPDSELEQFKIYSKKIHNDEIDKKFMELKNKYDSLSEIYFQVVNKIENENKENYKNYNEEIIKKWQSDAEKLTEEFRIENKAPVYREDKYCEKCDKTISYVNWATHCKTKKHIMGPKEKIPVKIICRCGSEFLEKGEKKHLLSIKHREFMKLNL